jgi:hypothetical protein
MRRRTRPELTGLSQAFDDARFGPNRTLNLRATLPTADAATVRAEAWLRQQQMDRASEVLVITGRGNRSHAGVSIIRPAIIRLLHVLKRRGVVTGHQEHTPGSFVVSLAPVSALWESPHRNRGRGVAAAAANPPSLDDLEDESRVLLRDLAERTLENLGVKETSTFLQGEMLKQFGAIAASVGGEPGRDARLRAAIRAALDQTE